MGQTRAWFWRPTRRNCPMAMLSMVSVSSQRKTSKSMSSTLAKLAGWMSDELQKQHIDDARENGVGGNDWSMPTHARGDTDDIVVDSRDPPIDAEVIFLLGNCYFGLVSLQRNVKVLVQVKRII